MFIKGCDNMSELVKNFFACSNTAKGFQNFFPSNLKYLDKIYILKGGPGTGKSSLMKKVGNYALSQDLPIEYIHCSSDPDSLDGVIIPSLSIAIVDGTAPHVIEPTAPGAIEEYVNLGTAWHIHALAQHKDEILYLESEIGACYPKAYTCFSDALKIHDQLENIYISQMDFAKANTLTETIAHEILGHTEMTKKSIVKHRFFGGATPKGSMDYVENLTSSLGKRYFIKGRPGSGKSTFLKKILAAAQTRGLDVEVYHCGFDPDSLDMLIFPELSLCLFDSTAPHEYFPSKPTDITIDMYAQLITPHTDETFASEIEALTKSYQSKVKEGVSHLSYAKYLHDDLEKYYINATDFNQINALTRELLNKISERIK